MDQPGWHLSVKSTETLGDKQAVTLAERDSPLSVSAGWFYHLFMPTGTDFLKFKQAKSYSSKRIRVPIIFDLFTSSPGVNGLRVVFSPKELTLVVHLSLVTQKYETIIVHSNLNVFGAWGWNSPSGSYFSAATTISIFMDKEMPKCPEMLTEIITYTLPTYLYYFIYTLL